MLAGWLGVRSNTRQWEGEMPDAGDTYLTSLLRHENLCRLFVNLVSFSVEMSLAVRNLWPLGFTLHAVAVTQPRWVSLSLLVIQ